MNIESTLNAFLDDQSKRLKERTMRDYEEVIHFFEIYLNGYGHNYLDGEKQRIWEARSKEDPECFTKTFGPDELSEIHIDEFLDYFIIRKVASGESFMKMAIRVMKKFSKWLFETKRKDEADHAAFTDYVDSNSKNLPNAEKLADMIYEHARRNRFESFTDMLEGYFEMKDVQSGQLWLDEFLGDQTNIGPVIVPKSISNLCQKDWQINLVIVKKSDHWYIVESGNVYPV